MPKIAFLGRFFLQLRMSITEADAFFLFFLSFFFRQTHKFSPSVFLPPPFYGKTAEEEKSVSIFVFFRGRPPRSQILFANISPEKSNGPSYGKCPLTMMAVATTKENAGEISGPVTAANFPEYKCTEVYVWLFYFRGKRK